MGIHDEKSSFSFSYDSFCGAIALEKCITTLIRQLRLLGKRISVHYLIFSCTVASEDGDLGFVWD